MGGLIDAAIIVEELHAVEPSTAVTILGTGLGLTPLILAGSPEQHERFLAPFLKQEGQPIASFVHSEPGGTANWLQKGAPGLQTTAYRDGDEWVVNGEKVRLSRSSHPPRTLYYLPKLLAILQITLTSSGPPTAPASTPAAQTSNA